MAEPSNQIGPRPAVGWPPRFLGRAIAAMLVCNVMYPKTQAYGNKVFTPLFRCDAPRGCGFGPPAWFRHRNWSGGGPPALTLFRVCYWAVLVLVI